MPEALGNGRRLKTACTHTCARPIGPLLADETINYYYLPPQVLSAAPKEGVAAERIDHEFYQFPLPSTASTMLRNESAANYLWTSRTNG
jgi:hypothetical protein